MKIPSTVKYSVIRFLNAKDVKAVEIHWQISEVYSGVYTRTVKPTVGCRCQVRAETCRGPVETFMLLRMCHLLLSVFYCSRVNPAYGENIMSKGIVRKCVKAPMCMMRNEVEDLRSLLKT
ncbi:hypothetical protein AVEN_94340-1 [Araneus ventricosus]|uniref:Uncharacterized protein n=1 Tax=Araneus ventricosus TaxID=182803 RepID=A0A4Y2E9M6_ARAVE|nr:hypothetical protein AVEN_94340-1 [Araneus ventricosus]